MQNLSVFYIESWIYSSALGVVEQIDAWSGELSSDTISQAGVNVGKGELLDLARSQVSACSNYTAVI